MASKFVQAAEYFYFSFTYFFGKADLNFAAKVI